jgi:2'-5' RNA ligase
MRGDRQLATAAENLHDFSGGSFVVDRLVLFRSQLGKGGSTYTVISEARFSSVVL